MSNPEANARSSAGEFIRAFEGRCEGPPVSRSTSSSREPSIPTSSSPAAAPERPTSRATTMSAVCRRI